MRTKFLRNAKRVYHCNGKELIKFACCLLMVIVTSCSDAIYAPMHNDAAQQRSWEVYCKKYNVNVRRPEVSEYDYFLDCWLGSAEEEEEMAQSLY